MSILRVWQISMTITDWWYKVNSWTLSTSTEIWRLVKSVRKFAVVLTNSEKDTSDFCLHS